MSIIPADPLGIEFNLRSYQVNFSRSRVRCYSLYAARLAVADPADSQRDFPGFVAGLDETVLPYHEEVIRCRSAPWGRWRFHVTNWSAVEAIEFDLEVFWGPRVNTTRRGERSFGVHPGTVGPLGRTYTDFELTPPWEGEDDGSTGITIIGGPPDPYDAVVVRPYGPVEVGFLAWNKAAFEGYAYEDFLRELGL